MKLGALISSGMNSWFSAYSAKNHQIACLIGDKNPILSLQAKAAQIPLITSDDQKRAIELAIEKLGIQGIVSGVIHSSFQKEKLEALCKSLKIELITPIWLMNEELFLQQVMKNFNVIISGVSAQGLKKEHLGLRIGLTFPDRMMSLNISPAGEDGKFETTVLDCPLFKKKIVILSSEKRMENECKGTLVITKATLA